MCFTKEMSGGFAGIGLLCAIWVYTKTSNLQLACGVFYFFLMEFLQYFQYLTIGDCENWWNQVLTLVGFAHICYQPYMTHIINCALTRNPKKLQQWEVVLKLSLLGGTMLFMRYFVSDLPGWRTQKFASIADTDNATGQSTNPDLLTSTEWLRGESLCTINGKHHLAWSVPMSDVSYYTPSAQIHSFLMFAPFFCVTGGGWFQGLFLFLTGPFMAAYITENLLEQASIWCFFSISQIAIMLFAIREMLLKDWDSKKTDDKVSSTDPYIKLGMIWPMGVVVPDKKKK